MSQRLEAKRLEAKRFIVRLETKRFYRLGGASLSARRSRWTGSPGRGGPPGSIRRSQWPIDTLPVVGLRMRRTRGRVTRTRTEAIQKESLKDMTDAC